MMFKNKPNDFASAAYERFNGLVNNPIQPEEIIIQLQNHLNTQKLNLNSSKGKDIVIAVGPTGAGKSTTLNIICEKKIIVNNRRFNLENENDVNSFKIGTNSIISETSLPQHISFKNLEFYDLAGFNDTRGPSQSFLNAAFMKNIIEQANSVKIMFIIDLSYLQSIRGQNFNDLLNKIKMFFPNIESSQNCVLIITKIDSRDDDDQFEQLINSQLIPISSLLQSKFLQNLITGNKILRMSEAGSTKEDLIRRNQEKKLIWEKLNAIQGTPIKKVNIGAFYTSDENNAAEIVCDYEIKKILKNILSKYNIQNPSKKEDITLLEKQLQEINREEANFQLNINQSNLILLLKPLFENIFHSCQSRQKNYLQEKLIRKKNKILSFIDKYQLEISYNKLLKEQNQNKELLANINKLEKEKQEFPVENNNYRIYCSDVSQFLFMTRFVQHRKSYIIQTSLTIGRNGVFYFHKESSGYSISISNGERKAYVTPSPYIYRGVIPLIIKDQKNSPIYKIQKVGNNRFYIQDTQSKLYWAVREDITKYFSYVIFMSETPSNFDFIVN